MTLPDPAIDEQPSALPAEQIIDSTVNDTTSGRDLLAITYRPSPIQRFLNQFKSPLLLPLVVGIFLRVILPTQPAPWGDEALTYSRVCGSFRDLLDILRSDGFVPLHYEMYWLLAQFFQLTPLVLRIIPIIAGVGMIPAMYLLARQLTSRKTATLVAWFTALSAFMLNYSRDAKMYPQFWTCATLMIGLYLWWLRRPRRLLWLAWIASGSAACGFDSLGLALLALLPVFALTDRAAHWKKMLATLIGVTIVAAGPVGYYLQFNQLVERTNDRNFSAASGTFWVQGYNRGRNGMDHVLYCTSAFLLGWEWPREIDQARVNQDHLFWYELATLAVLAAAALGTLPRVKRRFSRKQFNENDAGLNPGSSAHPADNEHSPQSWWRVYLWLGLWIVLPVYVFYCRSISDFSPPDFWPRWLGSYFGQRWIGMGICIVLALGAAHLIRLRRGAVYCMAAISVILLLLNFIFLPRAADVNDRFISSALVVISALAIYFGGFSATRRLISLAQFAGVTGSIYIACVLIYPQMDPKFSGSVWVPRYLAIVWPAFAITLCALIMRLNWRPLRWTIIGILLVVNLQIFIDRIARNFNIDSAGHLLITGDEPPVDRIARDVVNSDTARHDATMDGIFFTPRSSQRVYVQRLETGVPGPGAGTIDNYDGRYFLAVLGANIVDPHYIRTMRPFYTIRHETSPRDIAIDAARDKNINTIIIWRALTSPTNSMPDPYIAALGKGWSAKTPQEFTVHDHWIDAPVAVWKRLEYVRR